MNPLGRDVGENVGRADQIHPGTKSYGCARNPSRGDGMIAIKTSSTRQRPRPRRRVIIGAASRTIVASLTDDLIMRWSLAVRRNGIRQLFLRFGPYRSSRDNRRAMSTEGGGARIAMASCHRRDQLPVSRRYLPHRPHRHRVGSAVKKPRPHRAELLTEPRRARRRPYDPSREKSKKKWEAMLPGASRTAESLCCPAGPTACALINY